MPLVNAGQRVTASVLSSDYVSTDTSSITVTAASAASITVAYSIPANDAAVGTVYRLTTWGNGTWGSTQQILNFQGLLGANAYLTPQIGASAFNANQAIRWKCINTIICTLTGSTGTCATEIEVIASVNNTTWIFNGTNTNTTGAGTVSGTGTVFNTTIANSFVTQTWWNSVTGAPTITSKGSIFERLGG